MPQVQRGATDKLEQQQPSERQLNYLLVVAVEGEVVLFRVRQLAVVEVVELSVQEQPHQVHQQEQREHQHLLRLRLEGVVHQGQLPS